MKKLSRRHTKNIKKVLKNPYFNLNEAIKTLKKTATTKFIETVELHAKLNIDLKQKHKTQPLKATVILPYGSGQQLKIAVLTETDNFEKAKNAGADIIGNNELIKRISQGYIDFDILLTTPNLMVKLAKLGHILGPKGLMPSPKSGTITNDLETAVAEFKKGKFEYKMDRTGIVHAPFGKINLEEDQLLSNLYSLYNSIKKHHISTIKGKAIKSLHICTTMGPSIKLDLNAFI